VKLGDQLDEVFNRTEVYQVNGTCELSYCYWLVSLYQNSYGLDDVRKPEFMFQATAW